MAGLDEQCECPLCMEPLEIDDISFYPCTCGYQICRFCWHRIRTDENGLCPACRKQYSEDPAEFKPLTDDELQRIKKERRQKDIQRKQKAAESRKHLANVRVVQRNLVFVVGLSQRLADPDQLRKPEYFGKFGKIHKVVINQSTSYAGAQGPSASAYVTYCRASDALKAILNVNNVHIDGRTLKASLGTTKYCSHFLKGTQCQKVECMYLHEPGEEAASFTKEEMQLGKHQEYEQKLLQQFQNSQNVNNHKHNKKAVSPLTVTNTDPPPTKQPPPLPLVQPLPTDETNDGHTCWPALKQPAEPKVATRAFTPPSTQATPVTVATPTISTPARYRSISEHTTQINSSPPDPGTPPQPEPSHSPPQLSPRPADILPPVLPTTLPTVIPAQMSVAAVTNRRSLVFDQSNSHSLSLFSGDCFTPRLPPNKPQHPTVPSEAVVTPPIPDTLDVSSTTDWQAAFGFSNTTDSQDEDLGFDPLEESAKGLADLLQKERVDMTQPPAHHHHHHHPWPPHMLSNFALMAHQPPQLPPGFTHSYPNHMLPAANQIQRHEVNMNGSRMMGLMNVPPTPQTNLAPHKLHPYTQNPHTDASDSQPQADVFATKDWQDGLRALLPNINISFSTPPSAPHNHNMVGYSGGMPHVNMDGGSGPWKQPHPMGTDSDIPHTNHRLPFVQQFSLRGASWPPQTRNPPPGFQTMPPTHSTDQHTVTDPLQ